MVKSVPISSNTFCGIPFLGPPFLKKAPLKLQKGAHLTLIGQFLEKTLDMYMYIQIESTYKKIGMPELKISCPSA